MVNVMAHSLQSHLGKYCCVCLKPVCHHVGYEADMTLEGDQWYQGGRTPHTFLPKEREK